MARGAKPRGMVAMSGRFGLARRMTIVASLAACLSACQAPPESAEGPAIGEACLERIARDALANPRTNSMAANFAGPLGLVPSSDPDAAPYLSKQVEFRTADGNLHYFAVDSDRWTKALLVRLVPTGSEPRLFLFVLARDGTLAAAGRIDNGRLSRLDVADAGVRADARAEQLLWSATGPDSDCRQSE